MSTPNTLFDLTAAEACNLVYRTGLFVSSLLATHTATMVPPIDPPEGTLHFKLVNIGETTVRQWYIRDDDYEGGWNNITHDLLIGLDPNEQVWVELMRREFQLPDEGEFYLEITDKEFDVEVDKILPAAQKVARRLQRAIRSAAKPKGRNHARSKSTT